MIGSLGRPELWLNEVEFRYSLMGEILNTLNNMRR